MTTEIAIDTQNVARVYQTQFNTVHALRQINLKVPNGRLVVLKGRSGSGKTTLLNCISGLDTPTSGSIHVYGKNIANMSDAELTIWRRTKIGFVFQSMGLMPSFSAYENLDLMLRLSKSPRSKRRKQILDTLDQVGLLQWHDHRPFEMSGGQQQRVAIARALVTKPPLILADEPTSDLDSETTHDIIALFREVVETQGTTILISSHDSITDEYADVILHLRDGQIENQ